MAKREKVLHECLAIFQICGASGRQPHRSSILFHSWPHDPETKDMINNPMEFLGNLMLLIVGGNDTTAIRCRVAYTRSINSRRNMPN